VIDPADAHQLDQLLRRHRIDLKHSLGQNFLVDPAVRDEVAEQAALSPDDDVLDRSRCDRKSGLRARTEWLEIAVDSKNLS